MLYSGLMACYGLSSPLAVLLTVGGWLLVERYFGQPLNLLEIGLHNGVEHDASIVHLDCSPGQKNARIAVQPDLVADFAAHVVERAREDSCSMEVEERDVLVTERDIALTRVRRERLSKPLSAMHAEMARGEMAIILGVWHRHVDGAEGAPLPWLRTWLVEERLPSGWKPDHVQTLMDVVHRASAIRTEMNRIRKEEKAHRTRRKRRRGVLDIGKTTTTTKPTALHGNPGAIPTAPFPTPTPRPLPAPPLMDKSTQPTGGGVDIAADRVRALEAQHQRPRLRRATLLLDVTPPPPFLAVGPLLEVDIDVEESGKLGSPPMASVGKVLRHRY
ncbi:hypothetical protein GGX14DRAFT_564968 [Mycena pura]|uniref:Heme haloperoxidase family profile domain-containing protein n=1 Tax=Mycena pura TaxID=153505 RepID=A0AAD6YIA3_9AGAR|nr:hypothetical protein GGX14DRAFT_564968 [Mycena pura]